MVYMMKQNVSGNNTFKIKTKNVLENKTKVLVSKNEKVLECGPMESVFSCSTSKILDFLLTFRDYDYSISDIAKNSGVGFKTTLNEIHRLDDQGVIKNTRSVGKALMYTMDPDSLQAQSIQKLSLDIATQRAKEIPA